MVETQEVSELVEHHAFDIVLTGWRDTGGAPGPAVVENAVGLFDVP